MVPVEIYTRDWCGYCSAAKSLLERKGIPFNEINTTGDPELRRAMIARSNGRTTVPQIFIGAQHVGGCDDLYALDQAGRLDTLLAGPEQDTA